MTAAADHSGLVDVAGLWRILDGMLRPLSDNQKVSSNALGDANNGR